MNMIRLVLDLRKNFAEISKFESEVYCKLLESEREAEHTDKRFSSKDVLKSMKDVLKSMKDAIEG